jgi:hypothetical protein
MAAMFALLSGCVPVPILHGGYHDAKVRVSGGELYYFPWPSTGAEWTHIRVFGRIYSNPRGSGPCYLEIPQKNAMLFVTGNYGYTIVHLVDLTTHKERHFPAYDSLIGADIRDPEENTEAYEKVESVTGDILVISAGDTSFHSKHFIDFKEPRFIREERDSLDHGGMYKHTVLEGGKLPGRISD